MPALRRRARAGIGSIAVAADLLVASNRGPVSFTEQDDGTLTARRGGGGLVSGLSAATRSGTALWVCAALSDADREAARRSGGRVDDAFDAPLRLLDIAPTTFDRAYNAIANSTLWFVNHLLYASPTAPIFDATFRKEWQGYLDYNEAFAEALAAEAAPKAKVLVQDYHLFLVPGLLRARRPDLRIAHFTHTPWAPPDYFRMLPDDVGAALLLGVLGADHAGFLTRRWADAFASCAADLPTTQGGRGHVRQAGHTTTLAVHALGVDSDDLRARAHQTDVNARLAGLRDWAGQRQVVVRVDRTELSKNIVRGLLAFRELLATRPEWRGQVVHLAFAYPSRHDLPEYREYTAAVQRTVREINDEYGTTDWEPVRLAVSDDYPRSLAAMRMADVLVVNPVRDGMNLVAKEGPVLSDDGVALVLSREAGAAEEMAGEALVVNPYDVGATAEAIHLGLVMDPGERRERTARLAAIATRLSPQQWFSDQVAALE